MLFCLISLVGAASAEDTSNNELVRYDASIDMSEMETSSAVEVSSLNSNSNDMPNVVSNVNDTAERESQNSVLGSSLDESDGILSASHDLSGSTLQEIQNYLNSGSVAEGDTIYLGNQTWTSGNWGPWDGNQVVKVNIPNLIISGGTSDNPSSFATLSAGSKIFQLNAPGITLTNILFTNTGDAPQCAVNIQASDCTIENCVFDNCRNQNGGAIQASQAASNTVIDNCNFTNCQAIWSSSGGAIYYQGSDLTVTDCNFDSNSGTSGAVYSEGTTKVENCNFTGNNGGAVYSSGDAEISNCNFANHTGSSIVVDIQGCANVENSNFTNNNISGWTSGGALRVIGSNSQINDCNFENNSAASAAGIYVSGENTKIENCDFINNNATNGDGGAVYIDGKNTQITECDFENNDAQSGGAVYSYHDGTNIINSNFTNNSARNSGGAVFVGMNCHDNHIDNCDFTNNSVGEGWGSGGAIFISEDCMDSTITNSNFTSNTAPNGGAISTTGDHTVIENASFEDNNATRSGGAIYSNSVGNEVRYVNFTINNAGDGGAIQLGGENNDFNIEHVVFKDNYAHATKNGQYYIDD